MFKIVSVVLVFDNVSKELGFFVDERLMKILQEMPDEATARLIKIDKILGCLGLTSDEDIRRFVTFFIDETGKEDAGEVHAEIVSRFPNYPTFFDKRCLTHFNFL